MMRSGIALVLLLSSGCGAPDSGVAPDDPPPKQLSPELASGIARVKELLVDPSDARIAEMFTTAFLEKVPPTKVKEVSTQANTRLGACKADPKVITITSNTSATVRLDCERGSSTVSIVLESGAPHKISGLILKPAASPTSGPAPDTLSPALSEAMERVMALMADPSDDRIRSTLSSTFLSAIPPEKVKETFAKVRADRGTCSQYEAAAIEGETSADLVVHCERGDASLSITIAGSPPHLVERLVVRPL